MTNRTRIARMVRDFSFWITERLDVLADKIDGPLYAPSQLEIDSMVTRSCSTLRDRLQHPCPECSGKGVCMTVAEDDVYPCQRCHGFGVDPEWLITSRGKM